MDPDMVLQLELSPLEARQKVPVSCYYPLSDFAAKAGREVRVFVREAAVRRGETEDDVSEGGRSGEGGDGDAQAAALEAQSGGAGDDLYEFTGADYARLMASKKEERFLRLKKHRDQELQERRSRIQKAVIRVLFPDNHVVESTFSPSDSVVDVRALVQHCLANPDAPFYFFTAPPKRRIKDEAQDLYSAQLAPGALIHFAPEDTHQGVADVDSPGSHLSTEVLALTDLHLKVESVNVEPEGETIMRQDEEEKKVVESSRPKVVDDGKKTKPGVPKWFKR